MKSITKNKAIQLQKKADKVKAIQQKIEELQKQLEEIEENNKELRYLNFNVYELEKIDEKLAYSVAKNIDIICYATKNID